jgi:hypothetical protein
MKNNVVDKNWNVLRTPEAKARFAALGQPPAAADNALDQRTIGKNTMGIPLRKAVLFSHLFDAPVNVKAVKGCLCST